MDDSDDNYDDTTVADEDMNEVDRILVLQAQRDADGCRAAIERVAQTEAGTAQILDAVERLTQRLVLSAASNPGWPDDQFDDRDAYIRAIRADFARTEAVMLYTMAMGDYVARAPDAGRGFTREDFEDGTVAEFQARMDSQTGDQVLARLEAGMAAEHLVLLEIEIERLRWRRAVSGQGEDIARDLANAYAHRLAPEVYTVRDDDD